MKLILFYLCLCNIEFGIDVMNVFCKIIYNIVFNVSEIIILCVMFFFGFLIFDFMLIIVWNVLNEKIILDVVVVVKIGVFL